MKRPVTEIHEIELSSRCNLACKYCPHPTMTREKTDMEWHVFEAAISHAAHFYRRGTQRELSLTGIGEAALNPHFLAMATLARRYLPSIPIVIATNGIVFNDMDVYMLNAIRKHVNPVIFVSLHRPEVAAPAVERLHKAGIRVEVNHAFVDSSMDWAGQVKWHTSMTRQECQYLKRGWAVVRVDGRITTCCMDAHNLHTFGTVFDDPESLQMGAHSLCDSCNLSVPKELRQEERV